MATALDTPSMSSPGRSTRPPRTRSPPWRSTLVEHVGPGTRLDIEITEPPVTHTLLVAQLKAWLDRPATSPAEAVRKQTLKALLAS